MSPVTEPGSTSGSSIAATSVPAVPVAVVAAPADEAEADGLAIIDAIADVEASIDGDASADGEVSVEALAANDVAADAVVEAAPDAAVEPVPVPVLPLPHAARILASINPTISARNALAMNKPPINTLYQVCTNKIVITVTRRSYIWIIEMLIFR
jgi:hypothetical protein